MSIQLLHYSPKGVFLIIEVPVVAGKENPVIKTLWKYIPAAGKENKVIGVKIYATDLLPADRSFFDPAPVLKFPKNDRPRIQYWDEFQPLLPGHRR